MNVYLTKRNGYKRQLHGTQATIAKTFLIVCVPIVFAFSLILMCLPLAALIGLIAGIIMGFTTGWTALNLILILASIVILIFTRIRVTHN